MDKTELYIILDELRQKLDKENEYSLELKSNKRRSMDANRYMWVLCDRIAKAIKSTKDDVYREAIQSVGVYDDIAVVADASARLVKNWSEQGVGWLAESFGESKVKGADKVRVYYGSSTYDTKEMARLIDHVVALAKELGIETMVPQELERLKQNWRNTNAEV